MIALLLMMCLAAGVLDAQDAARQIWDTGFLQKRPAASKADGSRPARPPVSYQTSAPVTRQAQASLSVLGLTLWKLRAANSYDSAGARLLVQESPADPTPKPFTPERINLSEPLHEGDRIRLSIESPRPGFLYVIDRERYADGTVGDPVLIFPAGNFRSGTNDVDAGRIVEIPPQESSVPALKVMRSGERHIGEELLIVITEEPIPGLQIERRETRLSSEQVSRWETDWGVDSVRLDLAGSEHGVWTAPEKDAGENRRRLTQDDPMPATIFSVIPSANKPLLLHIPLKIASF